MFKIGVALMSDLAEAKACALQTVGALPFTLKTPAPAVWLGEITDSGVEVVVTGWIDQRETSLLLARGEALRQVKRAYAAAGIEMPNTTYTIQMAAPEPDAPGPAAAAQPQAEPSAVQEVVGRAADDLDALIEAEREEAGGEDLLRDDALKE